MWVKLSEGIFFFGPGGVTIIKDIDLRDKPESFMMRSELYSGGFRVAIVKETSEVILEKLGGKIE
jgi:hypothetical protein